MSTLTANPQDSLQRAGSPASELDSRAGSETDPERSGAGGIKPFYESLEYAEYVAEQKRKGLLKRYWKDLPQMWLAVLEFRREYECALGLGAEPVSDTGASGTTAKPERQAHGASASDRPMKKKRPPLDSVQRMARRQRLTAEQERDVAEYIKHCPSKAALWPCPLEAFAEKLMKQQPPSVKLRDDDEQAAPSTRAGN